MGRRHIPALALSLFLLLVPSLAVAAVAVSPEPVPVEIVDTGNVVSFADWVVTYVYVPLGVLLAGGAGWLMVRGLKLVGINVSAKHRETFQSAAQNVAAGLLAKLGTDWAKVTIDSPIVRGAVLDVKKRAEQAIDHFGIDPKTIAETIVAKLAQLPAAAATAPEALAASTGPADPVGDVMVDVLGEESPRRFTGLTG